MELCVGIDLGTTNSVLAVVNQKPNGDLVSKVVDLSRAVEAYSIPGGSKYSYAKKPLLPSYVYYRPESEYASIVGDYAKGMYAKRPHLVVKSIKSQMGNAVVEGVAEEIPDTTPARISSRILLYMINQASKIYHQDIRDVVITVPANFDAAMCKATLEAAALAGVTVRRADGSEKPILLSEPNAVIYDLINQIRNGEIHEAILDLSEPRQVLVFDIGGGTLDITLHTIKWREEAKSLLKVDEIATNRYTRLGGDDFDEVIARQMLARYIAKYKDSPAVVDAIRKEEASVMAQLRIFAEGLKIELNNRMIEADFGDSAWGWDDEETDGFAVGGHMGSTGYAYDDYFTTEEVESYLEPFMGRGLVLDDYKRLGEITDTNTIIYPILDVLQKAANKLGADNVHVDAVVLNGGMSKFYMVPQRLKEFFGFEPIVALDPDQAVARGAAIYHHYLRINEKLLEEDMRLVGDLPMVNAKTVSEQGRMVSPALGLSQSRLDHQGSTTYEAQQNRQEQQNRIHIEFGKTVLNEGVYLGLKNGVEPVELVATGEELPFQSPVMKGFKILPKQDRICIPIQVKNIDGTMQTIAKGNIVLRHVLTVEAYVAFVVSMSPSKVLTMQAWVSADVESKNIIEDATVTIEIGHEKNPIKTKDRLLPPAGSMLRADYEINSLIQLCHNLDRIKNPNHPGAVKAQNKIKSLQTNIFTCSNPQDFAQPILEALMTETSQTSRLRLYIISRRICTFWTPQHLKQLADACMNDLAMELAGIYNAKGSRINVLSLAIITLAKCANEAQLMELKNIRDPKLTGGLMYTFALRQVHPEWIYWQFENDVSAFYRGKRKGIQDSVRSLGLVLSQYAGKAIPFDKVDKAIRSLLNLCKYQSVSMNTDARSACILSLGWICDQRSSTARAIDNGLLTEVQDEIQAWNIQGMPYERCCTVAYKMVSGCKLDEEDNQYLLSLVEKMAGE